MATRTSTKVSVDDLLANESFVEAILNSLAARGVDLQKATTTQPREIQVTRNVGDDARKFGVATLSKKMNGEWFPKVGIKEADIVQVRDELTAIIEALEAEKA